MLMTSSCFCIANLYLVVLIQNDVANLQQCVLMISDNGWCYWLKLNSDKTEVLWSGTSNWLNPTTPSSLTVNIGSFTVTPTDSARLRSLLVSTHLSLQQHLSVVTARCFYQLRQIRCVRLSLDKDSTSTLVHAFVYSRIYYCYSLLNAAAHVVTNSRMIEAWPTREDKHYNGGAENAGVENVAPDDKGGKRGSGKRGTRWQGNCVKTNKDRHIYSLQQKFPAWSLVSGGVRFVRIFGRVL